MKEYCTSDFATLVGIDWADQKHDICELSSEASRPARFCVISSRPEAIHEWAMGLQKRYANRQIAVACELKKGPLIYALSKYAFITLFPLHPATVAKMRKAFHPSGAKSDPADAQLQAELPRDYMHKLTPIVPDTPSVRALTQLVECRRKLVQDRVDLTNSLTYYLKNYYPQALGWFNEKDTHIFCDFILKWPSLSQVKRARERTIIDFMHQHNVRYDKVIKRRLVDIKSALALTEDEGIVVPNQLMVELGANQLKVLLQSIERIEAEINERYRATADRKIFDSFPGAGEKYAPRLLVAFGSNRERYKSASEMHKYAGIAPVIESSGKKSWIHWRYACPKFLRQTFVEWAGQTVRYSFWARAYYQQQKHKGKPHNTIIRSLAFKWIRIMFRCWKEQKPYDESKYLEALRKRGSPLLKYAVEN